MAYGTNTMNQRFMLANKQSKRFHIQFIYSISFLNKDIPLDKQIQGNKTVQLFYKQLIFFQTGTTFL
ncbi:hypothetical protein COF47_20655 [Bacillus wiedmannii]|nr:hypothetical protein COF47_20655 [Bacillus wiedmannii]